ncbi:AraC family transcriptional regulator [Ochrobactrum intermedium]|uniref:AraC family transcriptional regulator n=1 Tax=Brucella intermedia TaxID=94625 RepID=A0ABR6AV54_9HYPH|nr:AraC family transcriptional regulator [Brucella intermedia]MBA8853350.1 AraC family transcriptional regulator [Brucella intermedia]
MLSFVPEEWGPQLHGSHGSVIHLRTGPNAIKFNSPVDHAAILLTPQSDRLISLNGKERHVTRGAAGVIEIIPAKTDVYAEWLCPLESIFVAFSPLRMRELALAEFGNEQVEFCLPLSGHVDSHALKLAKFFQREFQRARRGPVNKIYLDSLLTLFGTHLLRRYANAPSAHLKPRRGGLPSHIIRRVDDFIRANLSNKITVVALAAVAGLSPTHFTRAFRETTGRAPYQYITIMRLQRAAELAGDRSLVLGEIANKTGFSTHSQMTAIMKQYWGVTPSDLRRLAAHKELPDRQAGGRPWTAQRDSNHCPGELNPSPKASSS